MATETPPDQQQHKRVSNACRYCKKRKVKCSGTQPCITCSRRRVACVFEEVERKVLVSERYLQELERGLSRIDRTPDASRRSHSPETSARGIPGDVQSRGPEVVSDEQNVPNRQPSHSSDSFTNPLVSQTSAYVLDSVGRYRFLGPSSTWAFCQRVFKHLQESLPENQAATIPLNVDGSAYHLEYTTLDSDAPPDTTDLPSIDYTLYLMNSVKFHNCQMLRPFDEEEFTRNLYEFHEQGAAKIQSSRLWFVQFLLIIALGKAMIVVVKDTSTAPGSAWFQRAMCLMPDFVRLLREPNLAIQVLCLVALYLVSIDMKEAAYGYIGQAVRICLVEGLHREAPRQVMGDRLANYHRDLWWTVYILDRRLSCMIGAPCSIQDSDITCPLPAVDGREHRGAVLNVHVKISRLMAQILNSVYSVERLSRPFVKVVQGALRDMAAMTHEMDVIFTSAAYGSVGAVSTVAGHINLSYHQCIILATRPLLLHLLVARLKGTFNPHDVEKALRPQTKYLLETCLQSARMTLKILVTLYEHHLLDAFLPFDLESVFSAAFIITMAAAIIPSMISDFSTQRSISYRIIDYLIRKGNIPARLRKKELQCLDQMIQPLFGDGGFQPSPAVNSMPTRTNSFSPGVAILGSWIAAPGESGLSPSQMLNIADQLELQGPSSAPASADRGFELDWAQTGPWTWWFDLQSDPENHVF
ncbi:hypothetical protein PV04_03914 [Phialophora macrospora]|uniref:Zn(2)-C6 fungal-type domain-containing protein n=1 Tax=Phialophora macrospora TaxID=1851006 RepID=A0A0D2FMR0_9EURO|nr:hypothetical protein PV04_03914 [Phialophora macrospora]